jgi:hypothetical protein
MDISDLSWRVLKTSIQGKRKKIKYLTLILQI